MRIVDDAGEPVDPGEPGEILVRGFNVMKEYFEDPKATEQAIDPEGWLRTGDIGFVGRDGNLRITDRKKDMYIVGGFNAYPAEIESIMVGHPRVGQVAVVGVPDARLGEVGVAFVVARPGHTVDPDELVAWCRDHMANFKVPAVGTRRGLAPAEPDGQGDEVRTACAARRVNPGAGDLTSSYGPLRQVQATTGPAAAIMSDS